MQFRNQMFFKLSHPGEVRDGKTIQFPEGDQVFSTMAVHSEKRTLPFTPEQIFDLVADVERYPDFLPLWHAARISRSEKEENLYFTEQTLQLGPLRKSFRTETRMQRPDRIQITSTDPLFDEFAIQWLLKALPENACHVDFSLRCTTASLLLRPVIEVVLAEAAQSIVSAFERRAYAMYY